jgi:hypothetical protein
VGNRSDSSAGLAQASSRRRKPPKKTAAVECLIVHRVAVPLVMLLAMSPFVTAAGQQRGTVDVRTGTGLIIGRVIDAETDRPISGAVVTTNLPAAPGSATPPPAPDSPGARRGRPEQVRVLTGQDGRFLFHRSRPAPPLS